MKFLLVEDDEALAGAIKTLLGQHHYVMDLATDGVMGQNMAEAFSYDLILLDWSLPKLEGVQLCKHLRNEGNDTPIILLTARNDSTDKVNGLDAGADDYLVKPFEFEELLARIRALLRRAEGIVSPVLQWGDLRLDPRSSEVTCRDIPIAVTPKEYALLELFLRNPNRIFSLDNLLDKVWPFEDSPSVGSVRTHIKGLRQKLKKAGLPDIVTTVYGLGYRLKPAGAADPADSKTDEETADLAGSTSDSETEAVGKLDLASLWQGVSESYRQRVTALKKTLHQLRPGFVEQTEQQEILAEVHSLAGSLGSFGFQSVSQQCREIERIFRMNADLTAEHIQPLNQLITKVQKALERGLSQTELAEDLGANAVPVVTSRPAIGSGKLLSSGQLYQLLIIAARNDRDQSWLKSLMAAAADYQMQVSTVDDVAQVRRSLAGEDSNACQSPDIVVLDLEGGADLPDNNSNEFGLLAELQAARPPIPSLVLTAAASFENRVKVARMGAAGLLQVPITPVEVLEAAVQVLQKGAPPAAKLLIVDDDADMLALLKGLLQPWGFQLQLLSDPQHFWQVLERFEPDLVLLDVNIPQISGFDLCQVLRNAPRWHDLPVLFMSGDTDAETIQQVFSAGADDYIRKPIVAPELVARVLGWLERSHIRQLRTNIDSLTGVANRQKSTRLLTRLLSLAQRQGQTLCFVLIDFDPFKQVNLPDENLDEYGYWGGDSPTRKLRQRQLKRFGESLRSTFRNEDVVGRWAGEEFVIGLYGINRQEGAQRLRQFLQTWQQVQLKSFGTGTGTGAGAGSNITFTTGLAVYPDDGTDLQQLYRTANGALHKAKAARRH